MSADVPTPSSPSFASSGLVAMLHASRRRDAARVIHRHKHLLTGRAEGYLSGPGFAMDSDAYAGPAMSEEAIKAFRKFGGYCLIAVFVLAVGAAHVIGATILMRAAPLHAAVAAAQGD